MVFIHSFHLYTTHFTLQSESGKLSIKIINIEILTLDTEIKTKDKIGTMLH